MEAARKGMTGLEIIKYGCLSDFKHPARTLCLFVIAFVLAFQLLPGLAALTGIQQSRKTERNRMLPVVNVAQAADTDAAQMPPPLTAAVIHQLSGLKTVRSVDAVTYRGGVAPAFSPLSDEEYQKDLSSQVQTKRPGTTYQAPNILLKCATDLSKLGEFTYGGYSIISGRSICADDAGKPVAVISSVASKQAHLRVGDTLTVSGCYAGQSPIALRIVGIYRYPSSEQPNYYSPQVALTAPAEKADPDFIFNDLLYRLPDSTVYVPFGLADTAWWSGVWQKGDAQEAYFTLKSPSDIAAFLAAAKKLPGMDAFQINTYGKLYTDLTEPLDSTFTVIMRDVLGGVLGCLLLLCVMLALFQRGRRTELRSLFALGIKKSRIALQTAVELLLPVAAAFLIEAALLPYSPNTANFMGELNDRIYNAEHYVNHMAPEQTVLQSMETLRGKFYPQVVLNPFGCRSVVTPGTAVGYAVSGLVLVLLVSGVSAVLLAKLRPSQTVLGRR